MIVYLIRNEVNGHGYVGITTCDLKKRWREHKCAAVTGNNRRLYKAMRKYGIENFSIEQISTAESFVALQAEEKRLIEELNTSALNGRGYNLTEGGEGRDKVDQLFGEQLSCSVLTEEVVAYIRADAHKSLSNKVLHKSIYEKFGIACAVDTVRDARRGDTWTHLNEAYPPVRTKQGSRKCLTEGRKKDATALLAKHHAAAIVASAMQRKDRRGVHARISEHTVKAIFYSQLSLKKTAELYGCSKRMVLFIKQRKAHVYLTKEL